MMIQSVLSNLGILLLMHLLINTCYYLNQLKKLSDRLMPFVHILIVSGAVISMFYFPVQVGDHLFDLRLAPLIFVAFFHGWRYTVPILLITSIWRLAMGGEHAGHEVLFGLILPSILPMFFYPVDRKRVYYIMPFFVITSSWIISDITIIWWLPNGWEIFSEMALFRYISLMLGSFILYMFINSGRKHLELTNKLQYYAERDPLTGLYNMRKFETIIKQRPINKNKQMFVAMVDIDHFKKINDGFGHLVGDEAIRAVAHIILQTAQNNFIAARYGGDEFIFFIEADHADQAFLMLDNLRKKVAEAKFLSTQASLSLSVGMSELERKNHLIKAIERADKMLYQAKKNGRNRVCG